MTEPASNTHSASPNRRAEASSGDPATSLGPDGLNPAMVGGDVPIQLRPDVKALFCRDPEGNVLELVEYADIAAYRPDLFNDRSA